MDPGAKKANSRRGRPASAHPSKLAKRAACIGSSIENCNIVCSGDDKSPQCTPGKDEVAKEGDAPSNTVEGSSKKAARARTGKFVDSDASSDEEAKPRARQRRSRVRSANVESDEDFMLASADDNSDDEDMGASSDSSEACKEENEASEAHAAGDEDYTCRRPRAYLVDATDDTKGEDGSTRSRPKVTRPAGSRSRNAGPHNTACTSAQIVKGAEDADTGQHDDVSAYTHMQLAEAMLPWYLSILAKHNKRVSRVEHGDAAGERQLSAEEGARGDPAPSRWWGGKGTAILTIAERRWVGWNIKHLPPTLRKPFDPRKVELPTLNYTGKQLYCIGWLMIPKYIKDNWTHFRPVVAKNMAHCRGAAAGLLANYALLDANNNLHIARTAEEYYMNLLALRRAEDIEASLQVMKETAGSSKMHERLTRLPLHVQFPACAKAEGYGAAYGKTTSNNAEVRQQRTMGSVVCGGKLARLLADLLATAGGGVTNRRHV
ncbi:MAG: hypothetical protein SGPRY_011403 [Prymnesium sp.]